MRNGASRDSVTTADRDEETVGFLPSFLFDKKKVPHEDASFYGSPPPPPSPQVLMPLSDLTFDDNISKAYSCCSSPDTTPRGISQRKRASKSSKTNHYRDMSRASLPTRRGRQKVLVDTTRNAFCAKPDTSILSSIEPQRDIPCANMAKRFAEDLQLVREYRKAREQRLVLDHTEQILVWLTMQERYQEKDSVETSNVQDSLHRTFPPLEKSVVSSGSWVGQGNLKLLIHEEEEDEDSEDDVLTLSGIEDERLNEARQNWADSALVAPFVLHENRVEKCSATEQVMLTNETLRLVSWLFEQEERTSRDRSLLLASPSILTDTRTQTPDSTRQDQGILLRESAQLIAWLLDQESMRTKCARGNKEGSVAPVLENMCSSLMASRNQPMCCSGSAGTLAKQEVIGKEASERAKNTNVTPLCVQADYSEASGEAPPVTPVPTREPLTSCHEKGSRCTAGHMAILVTPPSVDTTSKRYSRPLSAQSNEEGHSAGPPFLDKPRMVNVPRLVSPKAGCQELVKRIDTPRSHSRAPSSFDSSRRLLDHVVSEPLAMGERLPVVPPSTMVRAKGRGRAPMSSTAVKVLAGMSTAMPRLVSANGIQYQRQSRQATLSSVKKNPRVESKSCGSLMQPPGDLKMVRSPNQKRHRSLGKINGTDDDGSMCSSISGIAAPRFISKDHSCAPSSAVALEYDEGYRHAQNAGVLWQTLVGHHVRFPPSWWTGAGVPKMGADGTTLHHLQWRYISLNRCYHPALGLLVRGPSSKGRLLLHIVVRDETWKPVQDIVIGCYYPLSVDGSRTSTSHSMDAAALAPGKSDGLAVWMGIRRRPDYAKGSTALVDPILFSESKDSSRNLISPLGDARQLGNSDLRRVFGDKPPKETMFILESELVKKVHNARDSTSSSTTSVLLLETFLFKKR